MMIQCEIGKIVLASASPYRKQLLEQVFPAFETSHPGVDEKSINDQDPTRLAQKRAFAKGFEVASREKSAVTIGADQVLSCGNAVFSKATCDFEAKRCLADLQGRTHYLHSAFCLFASDNDDSVHPFHAGVVSVAMNMRKLSGQEIDQYIRTGEWKGSVGCYKIEEWGLHLFEQPLGDYYAIVGLPLIEILAGLRGAGLDGLLAPRGPWRLAFKPRGLSAGR